MNIKYKDKNVEISINNINKNSILTNDELNSVLKIIDVFKDYDGSIRNTLKNVITKEQKKEQIKKTDDRPIIRDRLPNEIEMSDLEMKRAVTEHPMIRCPHCGQSSKAIVEIAYNENYFIRKDNNEFNIIAQLENVEQIENMCLPENASIMDYHNDITNIKIPSKFKNTDLNVNNNTRILCPVCKTKSSFNSWTNAFKSPLILGFETESLCEICGGEAVKALDENKNQVLQCECCGYKKNIVE